MNELLISLDALLIDEYDYASEGIVDAVKGGFGKAKEAILNLGSKILQAIRNFIARIKALLPGINKDDNIKNVNALKYVKGVFKASKIIIDTATKFKNDKIKEDAVEKFGKDIDETDKKLSELHDKIGDGGKNIYGKRTALESIKHLQELGNKIDKFLKEINMTKNSLTIRKSLSTIGSHIPKAISILNNGIISKKTDNDDTTVDDDASTDSWLYNF